MVKRNLIIVHLESLNMLNYRMNRHFFPTLQKIEENSLFFEKYYSSATSTIMVMSDLAYGGMLHDESCGGIAWALDKQVYQQSFFDKWKAEGYQTYIMQYPKDSSPDSEWTNRNHRLGIDIDIKEIEKYSEYLSAIHQIFNRDERFVLWTCCYTSNISFNKTELDDIDISGLSRWEESYKRLDKQVFDLISILNESGHGNDTILIFYGDHGDDLFQHGWYGGLTHAIEPFETLVHTPLFVLDNRIKAANIEKLVSTVDIGKMSDCLLKLPEREITCDEFVTQMRDYAVSRNLYAAQMVRLGNFEKSYSITDGYYMFMAGNRGMSLYYTPMDASCHNNLLELFELQSGEFVVNKEMRRRMAFHFQAIYDEKTLKLISDKANEMKVRLQKHVKDFYQSGDCIERICEIDFETVREDHFIDEVYDGAIGGNRACYGTGLPNAYYSGKKIILYGAGGYGKYCYEKLKDNCVIVAWIDQKWEQCGSVENISIQSPDVVKDYDYDVIIVSVLNSLTRQEIQAELLKLGVDKSRIIC